VLVRVRGNRFAPRGLADDDLTSFLVKNGVVQLVMEAPPGPPTLRTKPSGRGTVGIRQLSTHIQSLPLAPYTALKLTLATLSCLLCLSIGRRREFA